MLGPPTAITFHCVPTWWIILLFTGGLKSCLLASIQPESEKGLGWVRESTDACSDDDDEEDDDEGDAALLPSPPSAEEGDVDDTGSMEEVVGDASCSCRGCCCCSCCCCRVRASATKSAPAAVGFSSMTPQMGHVRIFESE